MTDLENLYQAVLANPADDLARLVYADKLEEEDVSVKCPFCDGQGSWPHVSGGRSKCYECHGSGGLPGENGTRAQFIRVQVERARLEEPSVREVGGIVLPDRTFEEECRASCSSCRLRGAYEGLCPFHALRKQERDLLKRIRGRVHDEIGSGWWREDGPHLQWTINADEIDETTDACGIVDRGFLDRFVCEVRWWIDHGRRVVKLHPVADAGVAFTDRRASWRSGHWVWLGNDGDDADGQGYIPRELRVAYDFVVAELEIPTVGGVVRCPNAQAAATLMARTAVFWARRG